MAKVKCLCQS